MSQAPYINPAPILYGIDPSVTYRWTHPRFRQDHIAKAFDRFWKERDLDAKDETERELILERDFHPQYKGRRVASPDAPWVEIKALPAALGIRLEAANSAYRRRLRMANEAAERQIDEVSKGTLSPAAKAKKIAEIDAKRIDENVARGFSIFEPELIEEVVSTAICGRGGPWASESAQLPPADQYELFWDIVNATAWTDTAFESFESAPVLQQA